MAVFYTFLSMLLAVLFLCAIIGSLYIFFKIIPTPERIRKAGKQSHPKIAFAGVCAGLFYGLLIRWKTHANYSYAIEVMSFAFIISMPIVIGFLTVLVAEWKTRLTFRDQLLIPWTAASLCLGAAFLLAWEGIICTVMFLPLFLCLASLGGVIAGVVSYFRFSKKSKSMFCFSAILLPFIISAFEKNLEPRTYYTIAENQIQIQANADTVWNEIKSVRPFNEKEHGFSWSHVIGFPRPVSAELQGSGVGAIRKAIFEGNLVFTETITKWQVGHVLAFNISANSDEIPPSTLDEHVIIGGKYFDVLEGTYRIERIDGRNVILHLNSKFRTATFFEPYTRLWASFIMTDLQQYILERIKVRAESVK